MADDSDQLVRRLQSQVSDLQQSLLLNKEMLSRLASSADTGAALLQMVRELTAKNEALAEQVSLLTSEKASLATQTQLQAQEFMLQIKQLQEGPGEQEKSFMKDQILLFQRKLAEKESQFIKADNELRRKKKEVLSL